jgi:hypothetical protein
MPPKVVLDAGALVAIEQGNRALVGLLAIEAEAGRVPTTHGGVVGQVWRGGARQALLAKALRAIEVVPLGRGLGREAGVLLASTGTADAIDAALVCLATDGDVIITSDPHDLAQLIGAAGADIRLVTV